ncbi:hypothetical protein ACFLUG_04770 [Chloroflexota bacterium]
MNIVAKPVHEPSNPGIDYIEANLPSYRPMLSTVGRFAYAWTFNPDENAIQAISSNLPIWLYLIGEPWYSPLRMHIVDFFHGRQPVQCPREWQQYCIPEEWGISEFQDWLPIHIWFLIDSIEELNPAIDVRSFTPYFDRKYRYYNINSFGIMQ